MTVAGQKENTLPLPHAAPWSEMEVLMASKLIGNRELGEVRMPIDAIKDTPRVGESIGSADQLITPEEVALSRDQARKAFEASLLAGRTAIETRCRQCHEDQDLTDENIDALRADRLPPLIPERWLARGIYDHAAHRKINCAFCHAQADPTAANAGSADTAVSAEAAPGTVSKPTDADVVMIRGIESCNGCHRAVDTELPASLQTPDTVKLLGGQSNWASDTCTECHRYHWKPTAAPSELPDTAPVPVSIDAKQHADLALVRKAIMEPSAK